MATVTMKMAKATREDEDAALGLMRLLQAIDGGNFPPANEDDEDWPEFDEDSHADLQRFHREVMARFNNPPSGLSRMLMAAHAALNPANKLFDPEKDYLEHHPRYEQMEKQLAQLLAAAKAFINADRSEHLMVRLNDAEMAAFEALKDSVTEIEGGA